MMTRNLLNHLILICVVLFIGCENSRMQYSDELSEVATVVDIHHVPSTTELVMKTSVDYDGNIQTSFVPETAPPEFGVTFRCGHGKFKIYAAGTKYEDLYYRMHVGEKVHVVFRYEYKQKLDENGEWITNHENIDFINAFAIENNQEVDTEK